ncbi:MAG: PTS lactose/cellobiose transporter subunit IIA [Eubacteriales bacterium]
MIDLEMTCFGIISAVGEARSSFVMAIGEAKKGNYAEAEALMEKGAVSFAEGHHAHLSLFESEVEKEFTTGHILLIHAEDQLMSAEGFRILATEFIDLYKRLDEKE